MTLGSATSFSYNISFIGMHPNNFKQTVKLGRCQTYKDKRIFFSLGNRKRLIKKKQKVFAHSWDDLSAGKTHYIHSTESSAGPSIPLSTSANARAPYLCHSRERGGGPCTPSCPCSWLHPMAPRAGGSTAPLGLCAGEENPC